MLLQQCSVFPGHGCVRAALTVRGSGCVVCAGNMEGLLTHTLQRADRNLHGHRGVPRGRPRQATVRPSVGRGVLVRLCEPHRRAMRPPGRAHMCMHARRPCVTDA